MKRYVSETPTLDDVHERNQKAVQALKHMFGNDGEAYEKAFRAVSASAKRRYRELAGE